MTLIGWGTDETSELTDILQELEYEIADQKASFEHWRTTIDYFLVGQVCASDPADTSSSYYGDSGALSSGWYLGVSRLGVSYKMFTDVHNYLNG